tara:strand:- start:625 stop:795 length:171 start_codon:yes stop_codon:yes gene_type:complete
MLLALDGEGVGAGAQINREPTPTRRLPADRAVTAEVRHGRVGLDREADGVAVAGAG